MAYVQKDLDLSGAKQQSDLETEKFKIQVKRWNGVR